MDSGLEDRPAIAAYVDAAARQSPLPLTAFRDGVIEHFGRLVSAMALVMEFPLADEVVAAPRFEP